MDGERRPVRFRELLRALVERDVAFIVVGGVAAVLEGAPVSTFDLDIVYSLDEENLARLARVLQDLEAIYVDPAGRSLRPDIDRLRGGGHHLLRTRYGRLDAIASQGVARWRVAREKRRASRRRSRRWPRSASGCASAVRSESMSALPWAENRG